MDIACACASYGEGSLMNWFRNFITGFLIGIANLIPGVSGGTFALILGVYERLITFLNSVNLASILLLAKLAMRWLRCGFRSQPGRELRDHLQAGDYPFMATLGFGTIVCILTMSSVMKYLLLHHFVYTYAYFFGLIVLSVIVPWRMLKAPGLLTLFSLLAGIMLTVFVSVGVNPYDKTLSKSQLLEEQYQIQQTTEKNSATSEVPKTGKFSYIGKYTPGEYLYIFICGILAISAMVLPGISGSLVLILLNQYFAVISAIANIRALLLDDLFFLSAMALGIILGILSFARFIEFAFRKFHDTMVGFLIGLILGSLYAIWPFKQPEIIPSFYVKEGSSISLIENYTVYSNVNILPHDLQSTFIAGVMVIAGMLTMLVFIRFEKTT